MAIGVVLQTSFSYFIPYFNKRLAFANGLFSTASPLAFFIFPPFAKILLNYFGLKGTLQLLSAIMSHVCICGALLRPMKYTSTKSQRQHQIQERTSNCEGNREHDECNIVKYVVKYFDLALFGSVRFLFQSIINGFLYGGFASTLIYIVPYSVSVGITDIRAPLVLSINAVCSLVVRLIPFGYLVDKEVISATSLTAFGFAMAGIATILMTFTNMFPGLAILAAFYGIGFGMGATFLILVVAYSGGSKETSSGAIAWTLLGRGLGSFVGVYGGGE